MANDPLILARQRLREHRSGEERTGTRCEVSEVSEESLPAALIAASEATWAEVERIADAGNAKVSTALALDAAGAHDQAEQFRAEVRAMVAQQWLPAMRCWARAADRAGQLPEADRFLLEDDDGQVDVNGYRRTQGGWVEPDERARRCVIHTARPLGPDDKLLCAGCRAAADATPAMDIDGVSLSVPRRVARDDPRLRELATVAALAAAHRDAAGGERP